MHHFVRSLRRIALGIGVVGALVAATPAFAQTADLEISKTADVEAVPPEGQFTYTITVRNNGPDAVAAFMTDVLPAEITVTGNSTSGDWFCNVPVSGPGGTVTCFAPDLDDGEAATLALTVMVNEGVEVGAEIDNTAEVNESVGTGAPEGDERPAQIDPQINNNIASVSVLVAGPDVTVGKSHAGNGMPGQNLTYNIVATNIGPTPTTGPTTVTDTLPTGLTPVSFTGTGWTCTLAPLSCTHPGLVGGGSGFPPLALVVAVDPAAPSSVTNQVTVATAGDTNPGNNSAGDLTIIGAGGPGSGALSLGIGFNPSSFSTASQVIQVQYLVTNISAITVTGIVVTDPKVPGIACPQTSLAAGASMTCVGPYTTTAADLAAGTSSFTGTASAANAPTVTANGAILAVALVVKQVVGEFITTRAALLAQGIGHPGLHDRVGNGVSVSETNGDATLNFSASLRGTGAGEAADALASGVVSLPFSLWIDGTLTLHARNNGGGSFALVGLGADYLVTEDLLLGVALYLDYMRDVATLGTVTGTGVLIGPYVSVALAPAVTLDAGLFYGRTWNSAAVSAAGTTFTGSFVTDRLVARAKLEGEWLIDQLVIRPNAVMVLTTEAGGAYTVTDPAGNAVAIDGFTTASLDINAGTQIERPIRLQSGLVLTPFVGARLGLTGSGATLSLSNPYGSLALGYVLAGDTWSFRSWLDLSLYASSLRSASVRSRLQGEF